MSRCTLDTARHAMLLGIGDDRRRIDIGIQPAQRPHIVAAHPTRQLGIKHELAVGRIVGDRSGREEPVLMFGLRFLVHRVRIGEIASDDLLLLRSVAHIIQPDRPAEFIVPVGVMQSEKQLCRTVTEHIAPCTVEIGFELELVQTERPGQSDTAAARQFMITVSIDSPVIVNRLHLQYVQKISAAQFDVEVEAAQVGEIVADAHMEHGVVVMLPIVGHLGEGIIRRRTVVPVTSTQRLRPVEPIIMVDAVRQVEFAFEQTAAEVLARRGAHAVVHPPRDRAHAEIVADIGPVAGVIEVADDVARTGILRRGIEIEHRVERRSGADFQIERPRTVELPVGHRSRTERLGREVGRQRRRRDGIVDFGPQTHRVGHIRHDGQLDGLRHLGNVGLGHLDLLGDLRPQRHTAKQHGGREDKNSFHGYFFNF